MSTPNTVLIELAFLPPISYVSLLLKVGRAKLDRHEHYVKASYRNRCYVLGPNGPQRLSVPLAKGKHQRSAMKDIEISYHEDWQKDHWHTLEACYRRSPYFEYYEDQFAPFWEGQIYSLWEFNERLLRLVLELCEIELDTEYSEQYEGDPSPDTLDARSLFRHNQPVPLGYRPPVYQQVFHDRHPFESNLSIIDLLFNKGPETKSILSSSIERHPFQLTKS